MHRTKTNSTAVLLLPVCLMLVLLGTVRSAAAADMPFYGRVIVEQVQVRASRGRVYYSVGALNKGDVVVVQDRYTGWYKIEPPEGVHSYIAQGFVALQGDGKTGVVTKDKAAIKAASVNGPGESYRIQVYLFKDDVVQIAGKEGSYFKIKPPRNAFVYLAQDAIERTELDPSDDAPLVGVKESGKLPEKMKPEEYIEATVVPIDTTNATETVTDVAISSDTDDDDDSLTDAANDMTVTTDTADVDDSNDAGDMTDDVDASADGADGDAKAGGDVAEPAEAPVKETPKTIAELIESDALKAAEEDLAQASKLPLEKRPFDKLIATYAALAEDETLPRIDQRIADRRLSQLHRENKLAKALLTIAAVNKRVAKSSRSLKAIAAEPVLREFDATGKLTASSVYDGKNMPRLYRLVAESDLRTIAYVRPGPAINPGEALGQVLGIYGKTKYDPGLKLQVIEAESVKILKATSK